MTSTIYIGQNIMRSKTDVLQARTLEQLLIIIKAENTPMHRLYTLVTTAADIDTHFIKNAKTNLPYLTVATFENNLRTLANVKEINYLILDFDNFEHDGIAKAKARQVLCSDERVVMLFASPGGKGIKCMFRLSCPMMHCGQYTQFYKTFAAAYSTYAGLADYVDLSCCDATRACFIAHDPHAYYNPNATALLIPDAPASILEEEKNNSINTNDQGELNADTYKQIAKTLNPQSYTLRIKQTFVPPMIHLIETLMQEKLAAQDCNIDAISDLNYGRKYAISKGLIKAEINLYYGKKGFQVVIQPKNGTDHAFNQHCANLFYSTLAVATTLQADGNNTIPPSIENNEQTM